MQRIHFIAVLLFILPFSALAAEKSGRLEGTIIGRDAATNQLTVVHKDVAGLMPAMTMAYVVRGQKVDALPANGAAIVATLHSSDGAWWLTGVSPVAKPRMQTKPQSHDMGSMPGMQTKPQTHDTGSMPGMQTKPRSHDMPSMPGMQPATPKHDMPAMPGMHHGDPTHDFLMRQASGTSMNPAAAPMHMRMTEVGDWMLMLHGLAFVSQVVQSGPRGDDKLFSTNWIMGMASRPLGGGELMFRSMLSLEPATVGDKYPELFQTGETLHGRPIIDAQHPHDFFMELAAEYAHPLPGGAIGYVYAAPVGDPSLGPVAYPHRASAAEIPQATLSHHVQDSTHIAASVLTIGAQQGMWGASLSGFRGQEPDQQRWDIEHGKIDSWAARVTFDPTPNWTAQLSTGHLRHPEALEPGNVQRTTASVAYSQGPWNTSLIFGHNKKSDGPATSSWLAESVLQFGGNFVTGRGEIVDKDELFAGDTSVPAAIAEDVHRIRALTLGYSRDLYANAWLSGAAGVNGTIYSFPSALEPYYGSNPRSLYLFVRLRAQ